MDSGNNSLTEGLNNINRNLSEAYNSLKTPSNLFSSGEVNIGVSEPSIMSENIIEPSNVPTMLDSMLGSSSSELSPVKESFLYSGWFMFILFLVLSFLGINVMYILSQGSKIVGDVGSGFFGYLRGLFSWLIIQLKNLLNLTGEGTKVGVDVVTGTGEAGLDLLDKTINAPKHIVDDIIGKGGPRDAINSGLDIPVQYNEEGSKVLTGDIKDKKKGGYCYIGTDNNIGSCMYVDREDMCMSKDIYPTMELCVNKDNLER